MQKVFWLFGAILFLFFSGCGGGGGSSSAPVAPKSYSAVEEANFSQGYTELGIAYNELLLKFNRFAAFDTVTTEAEWNAWLTALDAAVAAAAAAELYHATVADFEFSKPVSAAAMLNPSHAVASNTDNARKLLNLYESGNGPERLTLQYISEQTGKSITFLKALLNQVKSQKDAENWAGQADKYDRATKSCEFIRDTAITVNTALATVATGPLAVAGNFSKLVQGASTIKKIWTGTKVVYEVYSAGKLIDDVANKAVRLVVAVKSGDVPPQIPTFSEVLLEKTGLSKLDTVVSLATGVTGAIGGNWGERAAVITDTLKTGLGYFQGSDTESGGTVTVTSDDALEAHFTADNQLVDTKLRADQAMNGAQGSVPTANDKLAAQVGAGSYRGSYLENTQVSTLAGDVAEDSAGLNRSTDMSFDYDAVNDTTTITWDGDGDGASDFSVDVPGDVAVKEDVNGAFATTGSVALTLDKKQEQVVVAPPSSSLYDADSLLQNAWSAATTPAPVALDSLSGNFDGHYWCSGDAQGACDFWVTGARINGWFKPDTTPLSFDGQIAANGAFEVFGAVTPGALVSQAYANTFTLSGGVYHNPISGNWDAVNVWVSATDEDGLPLADECLFVYGVGTCSSNDPALWDTIPLTKGN